MHMGGPEGVRCREAMIMTIEAPPPLPPAVSAGRATQMGGPEGVRRREATMLTLQTQGTQGIRMFLRPREEEGAGGRM